MLLNILDRTFLPGDAEQRHRHQFTRSGVHDPCRLFQGLTCQERTRRGGGFPFRAQPLPDADLLIMALCVIAITARTTVCASISCHRGANYLSRKQETTMPTKSKKTLTAALAAIVFAVAAVAVTGDALAKGGGGGGGGGGKGMGMGSSHEHEHHYGHWYGGGGGGSCWVYVRGVLVNICY
ncbi:MAG TPA: hypothetical protein VIH54_01605 [Chthoniobacterales bacterium]